MAKVFDERLADVDKKIDTTDRAQTEKLRHLISNVGEQTKKLAKDA